MTNQQGGIRCRLDGEYIGLGNTYYPFKNTGWTYRLNPRTVIYGMVSL